MSQEGEDDEGGEGGGRERIGMQEKAGKKELKERENLNQKT